MPDHRTVGRALALLAIVMLPAQLLARTTPATRAGATRPRAARPGAHAQPASPVKPASPAQPATDPADSLAGLGASGLVYGKQHAFSLTSPPGWILDSKSGRANGMQIVFYRRGTNWKSAIEVMYANGDDMADSEAVALDRYIADDVASFRQRDPRVEVHTAVPLPTHDGVAAEVREFLSDAHQTYDAVAYVAAPRAVITLVLSARTRAALRNAYPDFRRLVGTYQLFLGTIAAPH